MRKFITLTLWFPATLATLLLSLTSYEYFSNTKDIASLAIAEINEISIAPSPYLAYAALPQTATNLTSAIRTGDARPVIIDLYLSRYDSPMQGYGNLIVETAEKYNMDPYLFVAISQQESNLGKKMPYEDCHNAWGYGIHSRGTLCFSSWEEGIEAVMKGIGKKFISQGLQDPEEIMRIYTPHSNGSWADGVNQFLLELKTGDF